MKLSIEEIDAIRISLRECAGEDGCKALGVGDAICSRSTICKRTMNLIDTIEAQQQEIDAIPVFKGEKEPEEWIIRLLQTDRSELLKWMERCAWHCKKVHELGIENRQLKAQAATMREALSEAISCITLGTLCSIGSFHNTYDSQISTFFIDKWTAALENAGKDYHNPADVEALRQAKEALELIYNKHTDITNHHKYPRTCVICREALTAIEKALGGNGDGC